MKQEFRLREIPQKCTFEQFFKAVCDCWCTSIWLLLEYCCSSSSCHQVEIQINEQVQQLCQAALRWFSQA